MEMPLAPIDRGRVFERHGVVFTREQPIISPQGVFVASKDSFEAVAHYDFTPTQAKAALFENLPLDEYGWCESTAKISKAGQSFHGLPMWRLDKG